LQLQARIQELQHKISLNKDTQSQLEHLHRQIMQKDYDKRLSEALQLVQSFRSELATAKNVCKKKKVFIHSATKCNFF
jgi:hypothetical protein